MLAYPDSTLKGRANLLVMPNLDTGNITYNMLKMTGSNGVAMGPILLGAARPVHILTTSATVRRIVNMTALAVVDAQQEAAEAAPAARPARGAEAGRPKGAPFSRARSGRERRRAVLLAPREECPLTAAVMPARWCRPAPRC